MLPLRAPRKRAVLSALLILSSLLFSAPSLAQSRPYVPQLVIETELPKEEQDRRNIASLVAITGANAIVVGTIPLGFIPAPKIEIPAAIANIVADNGLKFIPAVLYAPADLVVHANSDDQCTFHFDLPQSRAEFHNFLGFWPKFEYGPESSFGHRKFVDRLWGNNVPGKRPDKNIDFGVLGVPEVAHANTDVNLGVSIDDAPGFKTGPDGDVEQTVTLGVGIHEVTWTADTQWAPVWDLVIPSAVLLLMESIKLKYAPAVEDEFEHLGRLGKRLEFATDIERVSVTDDVARLAKELEELDRKIKLYALINGVLKGLDKVDNPVVDVGTDWLVNHISNGFTTVSRSRIQNLTVFDDLPPRIATTVANPRFEATDIGGARTSRYADTMRGYITASDPCDRAVSVGNDAPAVLPLGNTVVTWTARDQGPVDPARDHDGDGTPDPQAYNSRTVTQVVTIEDTQAPILVPPPGLVIESASEVKLADQALGQPLVVDLADLHPTVTSSTSSNGTVPPDTRTVVTWSATDDSNNTSLGQQLVTVKTPGTNTRPTVVDRAAQTLTSKPVDIVLTGFDADVLPFTGSGAGAGIPDPLQFKITQRPQHGEFVAPLYPFFIDDFRTDKVGGLINYINGQPNHDALMHSYITAVNTNSLPSWMNNEFCSKGKGAPVDFVFNPLFVQVTDDGEQYFFDQYLVCDPNSGTHDPEWATYPRISRWDRNNVFLGAVRLADNGGGGISGADAVFRFDRAGYLYFVNRRTGGEPVVSVQRCSANLTNTTNNPPFCFASFFGPIDSGRTSNGEAPQNAYVDSKHGIVYITAGAPDRVDVFRLDNSQRIGTLSDDAGVPDFLAASVCKSFGTFDDAMETDSQGNFYIIDNDCNRIHKFTAPDLDEQGAIVLGTYVGWMGRCNGSKNLACDVANGRTKGFSCTAAAACTIPIDTSTIGPDSGGRLVGQLKNPSFLSVDPNDVVYVADYGNRRVQRFAGDGTFVGQAQSTGNGVNAATDGSFVLGNMGPPKHVTVNSKNFFVVDQSEHFVHVFDTSPFKDVTDSSATVSYVSSFDFHSATDTFSYAVDDGLVASNAGVVSVAVARNYRQPLPTAQEVVTDEDNAKVIVLSGSDPDGILTRDFNGLDTLTFRVTKQPKHGKLVHGGNAGTPTLDPGTDVWTYTPDRDYHGADALAFTVRDAFTDATVGDDGTPIPEPYGEAKPAAVQIGVSSVNDIPIVRIQKPNRVGAGFAFQFQATAYDDGGDNYAATLAWGDGGLDRDGKVLVDKHGTPNDTSDDTATMTGVVYSVEGLNATGRATIHAMHAYAAAGSRKLTFCLRDDGGLESCDAIDVEVKSVVALGTRVELSENEVVDGIPFTATIDVVNAKPSGGAIARDATDVKVSMDLPSELLIKGIAPSQGSCGINAGVLECSLGSMSNDSSASIRLDLRGAGTLVYDQDVSLLAVVTTASEALDDHSVGSATVELKSVQNDRDGDGLPNIFEASYAVSDPLADDDHDGLNNRAEFDARTSPRGSDTDGDGVSDADEHSRYGTDPLKADTDGDGIGDLAEITTYHTDPLKTDSDGDGLPDKWEVDHGFNPLMSDGDGDADHDGLSDADEYRYHTDYLVADSDGDGLLDGDEVHQYGTDPATADTDGDALDDAAEVAARTDPLKPDSDDDGLLDGAEVGQLHTDPLHADTDRDGLPDGWEVRDGRDPRLADYAVAAGGLSTCALTDNGVECWGRNDKGQAPAHVPGLVHPLQVSVGRAHACAVDLAANGALIRCWGDNTYGKSTPPALVAPLQVAAGANHTCALDQTSQTTRVVKCWGRDDDFQQVSGAPTGLTNPVRLVSGGNSSCAVDAKPTGPELICWGQPYDPAAPNRLASALDPLALGSRHGCVVDAGNRLCWGLNTEGQAPRGPTPSRAVDLALGDAHGCALEEVARGRYQVVCWGRNVEGQTTVPASLHEPIELTAGASHGCVLEQGSAKCWGLNADGEAPASRVLAIDPDRDSLPTAQEIQVGTNPLDPDTDRDLLSDSVEIAIHTDPLDADSDDDGLQDGDEVARATNPLASDTDLDGVPDGWEVEHGLRPSARDSSADPDGDGLTNLEEYKLGTDPNLADTDGDGVSDGDELNVFRYVDSGQRLGADISEAVELGDLDGDGDLDAIVANRVGANGVWLNDGKGNFTRSDAGVLNGIEAVDVALFDVDFDGDLDALLAHPDSAQPNTLWLNRGNAVFDPAPFPLPPAATDGVKYGRMFHGPKEISMGLFVANWGVNQAGAFLPPHNFLPGQVIDQLAGNSEDVALGDLDGDGLDDAFVVNRLQPAQVFLNRGFGPPQVLFLDTGQRLGTNDFAIAVDLADIDGDGDLDAYEVVFGAGDRVWLNDGHARFTDSGQSLGNDGGNDVRLVDINHDGYPEALVANTGPNRVWLNHHGTFVDSGITMGAETSYGLAVGDVNGDGTPDAFFANEGPNQVWLLRQLKPTEADTDGDGASDGWEIEHGFDPLDDTDGALDSDGDGAINRKESEAGSDPHSIDTDGDGIPDGFEIDHGLDPLKNDAGLDLDGDGVGNLDEYRQGLDPQADDAPPQLTAPGDVVASSTGALTAVALGTATATDARDGVVQATPDDSGPFAPGRHLVTWSASDKSGNLRQATQIVDVVPLVSLGVDREVAEGGTVQVPVMLNGAPVQYPVLVGYTVAGTAKYPDDHDALDGVVSIAAGTVGTITIHTVRDFVFEGDETIVITLANATNAVFGPQSTQTLTIKEANVKPSARLIATQGGRRVTTVAADAGPVAISAVVIDPNPSDAHTFNWSASDSGVFDPARFDQQSYSIDPRGLAAGSYNLVLDITDDGTPVETNRVRDRLRVVLTAPVLSTTADSDHDGKSDAAEGDGDADGDRVPDYLDAGSSPSVLRYSDDGYVLETQPGLGLRLGARAFGLGAAADVPEAAVREEVDYGYPDGVADFEVTGVMPGASAMVVVPLHHPIPPGSRYRKFAAGVWTDFVVDGANSVASARGAQGACPAAGDHAYVAGIHEGDSCLELTLQDGGPNDADGAADGTIADPGGLAVPVGVRLEVVAGSRTRLVAESSKDNVVLRLRIDSDSGDVELDSVKVTAFGSGDDTRIKGVKVYLDSNGNGVVDVGEPIVATGAFARDNGELTLRLAPPYPLPAGRTELLVTYDL